MNELHIAISVDVLDLECVQLLEEHFHQPLHLLFLVCEVDTQASIQVSQLTWHFAPLVTS